MYSTPRLVLKPTQIEGSRGSDTLWPLLLWREKRQAVIVRIKRREHQFLRDLLVGEVALSRARGGVFVVDGPDEPKAVGVQRHTELLHLRAEREHALADLLGE